MNNNTIQNIVKEIIDIFRKNKMTFEDATIVINAENEALKILKEKAEI